MSTDRRLGRAACVCLALLLAPLILRSQRDIPLEQLLPDYAQPPSQFITVDSLDVHVRDEGSGTPLLLLHGLFASLHTWDGWAAQLQDSFRVIRIDLPGHGLTGPHPQADYSVARTVGIIAAIMDSLDADSFAIAGNSMGGGLAWEYALAYPEQVSALVLIDAVGYPRKKGPKVVKLGQMPIIRHVFRIFMPRCLVKWAMRGAYGDPGKITPELVRRYQRLILRAGNRGAFLEMLAQPHMPTGHERIAAVQAPALIMWGAADSWIPVEHAHRFHEDIAGSEIIIYSGVGHAPMEEIPVQSAADARRFLVSLLLTPPMK